MGNKPSRKRSNSTKKTTGPQSSRRTPTFGSESTPLQITPLTLNNSSSLAKSLAASSRTIKQPIDPVLFVDALKKAILNAGSTRSLTFGPDLPDRSTAFLATNSLSKRIYPMKEMYLAAKSGKGSISCTNRDFEKDVSILGEFARTKIPTPNYSREIFPNTSAVYISHKVALYLGIWTLVYKYRLRQWANFHVHGINCPTQSLPSTTPRFTTPSSTPGSDDEVMIVSHKAVFNHDDMVQALREARLLSTVRFPTATLDLFYTATLLQLEEALPKPDLLPWKEFKDAVPLDSATFSKSFDAFLNILHERELFDILLDLNALDFSHSNPIPAFIKNYSKSIFPVSKTGSDAVVQEEARTQVLPFLIRPLEQHVNPCHQFHLNFFSTLTSTPISSRRMFALYEDFIRARLTHHPNFIPWHWRREWGKYTDCTRPKEPVIHYQHTFRHPYQLVNRLLYPTHATFPSLFNSLVVPRALMTGIDCGIAPFALQFQSPEFQYHMTDNGTVLIVQTHNNQDNNTYFSKNPKLKPGAFDQAFQTFKYVPSRWDELLFFIQLLYKVQHWAMIAYINHMRWFEAQNVVTYKTKLPDPDPIKFPSAPSSHPLAFVTDQPIIYESDQTYSVWKQLLSRNLPHLRDVEITHPLSKEYRAHFTYPSLLQRLQDELDALRRSDNPTLPIQTGYQPRVFSKNELLNLFHISPQNIFDNIRSYLSQSPYWFSSILASISDAQAQLVHPAPQRGETERSVNHFRLRDASRTLLDSYRLLCFYAFSESPVLFMDKKMATVLPDLPAFHSLLSKGVAQPPTSPAFYARSRAQGLDPKDEDSTTFITADLKRCFPNCFQQTMATNIENKLINIHPFLSSLTRDQEWDTSECFIDYLDDKRQDQDPIFQSPQLSQESHSIPIPGTLTSTGTSSVYRPMANLMTDKSIIDSKLSLSSIGIGGKSSLFFSLAFLLKLLAVPTSASIYSTNILYQNTIYTLFGLVTAFTRRVFDSASFPSSALTRPLLSNPPNLLFCPHDSEEKLVFIEHGGQKHEFTLTRTTQALSQTPSHSLTLPDVSEFTSPHSLHFYDLHSVLLNSVEFNMFESKGYNASDFSFFNAFTQSNSLSPLTSLLSPLFSRSHSLPTLSSATQPVYITPTLSNVPLLLSLLNLYDFCSLAPGYITFPHLELNRFSVWRSRPSYFNSSDHPILAPLAPSLRESSFLATRLHSHRTKARVAIEYRPTQPFSQPSTNPSSLLVGNSDYTTPWNPSEYLPNYFQSEIYHTNALRLIPVLNPWRQDDDLMGLPAATLFHPDFPLPAPESSTVQKPNEEVSRFEQTVFGSYSTMQLVYENFAQNDDFLTLYRSLLLVASKLITGSKQIDISPSSQLARQEAYLDLIQNEVESQLDNETNNNNGQNTITWARGSLIMVDSVCPNWATFRNLGWKRFSEQKWNPVLTFGPRPHGEDQILSSSSVAVRLLSTLTSDLDDTNGQGILVGDLTTKDRFLLEAVSTQSHFSQDSIPHPLLSLLPQYQSSNILNAYTLSAILSRQHMELWLRLFQKGFFWTSTFHIRAESSWTLSHNAVFTFDSLRHYYRFYWLLHTLSSQLIPTTKDGYLVKHELRKSFQEQNENQNKQNKENKQEKKDKDKKDKQNKQNQQNQQQSDNAPTEPQLLLSLLLPQSQSPPLLLLPHSQSNQSPTESIRAAESYVASTTILDSLFCPGLKIDQIASTLTNKHSTFLKPRHFSTLTPFFDTIEYKLDRDGSSAGNGYQRCGEDTALHFQFRPPTSSAHQLLNTITLNTSFLAPLLTPFAPTLVAAFFKLAMSALDRLVFMSRTLSSYPLTHLPGVSPTDIPTGTIISESNYQEWFQMVPNGSHFFTIYLPSSPPVHFFIPRELTPGTYILEARHADQGRQFVKKELGEKNCVPVLSTVNMMRSISEFKTHPNTHPQDIPGSDPDSFPVSTNAPFRYMSLAQENGIVTPGLPQIAPLSPLEYHLMWLCFSVVSFNDATFNAICQHKQTNNVWSFTEQYGAFVSEDLHETYQLEGENSRNSSNFNSSNILANFNPFFLRSLLFTYVTSPSTILEHMKSMYGLSLDAFLQATYVHGLRSQPILWSTYHSFGTMRPPKSLWDPIVLTARGSTNSEWTDNWRKYGHSPHKFPFPSLLESMAYVDAGITSMEHSLLDGIQYEASVIEQHQNRAFTTSQWLHDPPKPLSPCILSQIKSIYPEIPSSDFNQPSTLSTTEDCKGDEAKVKERAGEKEEELDGNCSSSRPPFRPLFYTGLLFFLIDSISNPIIDDVVTVIGGFVANIEMASFERSHFLWLVENHPEDPALAQYSESYPHLLGPTHEMVLSEPCTSLLFQPWQHPAYLSHVFRQYKSMAVIKSRRRRSKRQQNDQNDQKDRNDQKARNDRDDQNDGREEILLIQAKEPPVVVMALIRAIQRGHYATILSPILNLIEANGLTSTLAEWRLWIQRRSTPQFAFISPLTPAPHSHSSHSHSSSHDEVTKIFPSNPSPKSSLEQSFGSGWEGAFTLQADVLEQMDPVLPPSQIYSTMISVLDILAVSTPVLPVDWYQSDANSELEPNPKPNTRPRSGPSSVPLFPSRSDNTTRPPLAGFIKSLVEIYHHNKDAWRPVHFNSSGAGANHNPDPQPTD